MLMRPHRLTTNDDFTRVRRQGRAVPHPLVLVTWMSTGAPITRFGFSVSKRVGNAVVRNRVKRRIREAARALYPEFRAGYDIVLIARTAAAKASEPELAGALASLLDRARLRIVPVEPMPSSSSFESS